MHITVGGALTLVVLVIAWIFAASISNDAACQSAEAVSYMSGPTKAFTKFFLLCWLV